MFGKPAKVPLTVKADDPTLEIEMPVLSLDAGNTRKPKQDKRKVEKPAPKVEKPIEKAAPTEEAAAEDEEAPRKSRNRRRRRGGTKGVEGVEPVDNGADEAQAAPAPAPIIEHEPFLPTPVEAQSEEAKRASAFLSGLTERMGVPVAIALQESPEQLRMQMTGEGMSLLIGRRGETLDALQYLTSLNINRGREEYLRVSIDTENYRAKREEALRKLAIRMAGRAKKSGRRVALEPMNPYERRILHSALQDDPDVTTHSEGEEPYRRVIITLR
jgi:spoIIIJ-associated protein